MYYIYIYIYITRKKHKKIKVNRNFLKVNSKPFRLYAKGKPVYILATYCLWYPHQMSFLWNKML